MDTAKHPVALCTAVEPFEKEAMCEQPVGHRTLHKARIRDAYGTSTIEWPDSWQLVRAGLKPKS